MVRLVRFNIAGLKTKQNRVSRFIIENNYDIVCIQELHNFEQELIHNFEKDVQGIFIQIQIADGLEQGF